MSDFASLLVGIAAIAAVVVSYVKTSKTAKEGQEKVAEVHVLVNSKMAEALERINKLEHELAIAKKKEGKR